MNNQFTCFTIVVLGTLAIAFTVEHPNPSTTPLPTAEQVWHKKGVAWLISAQSENGGWGNASHADHTRLQLQVETDPATTAFAAMALLEAGGLLSNNSHKAAIMRALDCILLDIQQRPANGRITALTATQPQRKLGMHVDASMALDFLTAMRQQLEDPEYLVQIDSAASICIALLAASQNPDGQWKDGGWAPVLQNAINVSALENAENTYAGASGITVVGSRAHATDLYIDGLRVLDGGAVESRDAGVPLYNAASILHGTAADALEVESVLSEARILEIRNLPIKNINTIAASLSGQGMSQQKATRLAKAYKANIQAKEVLSSEATWIGFGSNGGEEYLSYKLYSETLEKQNQSDWKAWKTEIESKFKSTQNPNGSWSGHHCITSPVFCTAAVLLAWYGKEQEVENTFGQ